MTVTSQAISKILLLGWCASSVISQVGDKDEEVVEVVHTCARSPGEMDSEINTTNSLLSILIDKYASGVLQTIQLPSLVKNKES